MNKIVKLKSKLLQTGPLYALSSMWLTIVTMISGVVVIRWINPLDLGLWQSISIIQLYTPILDIGISNGLNRELPYLIGKRQSIRGIFLARTAQGYSILISCLLAFVFIAVIAYRIYLGLNAKTTIAIVGVGLISVLNIYSRYLTVTFRSSQSFRKLAVVQLFTGFSFVITLPLIYYFGYFGLVFNQACSTLVSTIGMHFNRPIKDRPIFNFKLKPLIKTGLPVFIMGYIRGITASFNRIIILMNSTLTMVGLFGPVMAISGLNMMPKILSNYFFPKMNVLYGATDDSQKLWPMALRLNRVLFMFALPVTIAVAVLMPYLMPILFPNYVESVRAIQIMSVSFLFSGTLASHNVLYVIKAYKVAFIFTCLEVLLLFGIPFLAVYLVPLGVLESVAVGYVIAQFLLFIANIYCIRFALNRLS